MGKIRVTGTQSRNRNVNSREKPKTSLASADEYKSDSESTTTTEDHSHLDPVNTNISSSHSIIQASTSGVVTYKPLLTSAEAREVLRRINNRPAIFRDVQRYRQASAPHPETSNVQNCENEEDPEDEESIFINTSVPAEKKTIPTKDEASQYDMGDFIENYISAKKYCKNKDQYIAKKVKNNQLLYSAEFLFKLDNEKVLVKIHGSASLLTADKGKFLASVKINPGQELDFQKPFKEVKLELYRRYVIIKIYQDFFLDEKNRAFDKLKRLMVSKIKIIDDRECAEDILQLSHIISQADSTENAYLLTEIIKNRYVSDVLKLAAQQSLTAENNLLQRNRTLPSFSKNVSVSVNDLYQTLKNVSEEGIMKHRERLRDLCPSTNFRLLRQLMTINSLPSQNLFHIRSSDITLFSDLYSIYKQRYPEGEIIIQAFLDDLWHSFYNKVKKVKKYEPVQNVNASITPVYVSLFKSFLELQREICTLAIINVEQLLLQHDKNTFKVCESIAFPESLPINSALEHQYRLIFKLLKFYNPNNYSPKQKFKYEFKLKEKEGWKFWNRRSESLSNERLVWLFILDCGLSCISLDTPNEHIVKLSRSLFEGFSRFIRDCEHDRFESFRISTHNIIKFAVHVCPFVSSIGTDSVELDHRILEKQISLMSDMLSSDDGLVMDHFPSLIEVYNEYWKSRSSLVGKVLEQCPFPEFKEEMKNGIFLRLLEVVDTALSKKVSVQNMSYFFRLYHEFLEHFKSLKFEWLVSASSIPELVEKTFPFCIIVNKEVNSFKVSNAEEFIKDLISKKITVPKHYFIELMKELLAIVIFSMAKENWSDGDQLKAAGDLFLAIGHSFVHFKKQADDRDFENFLKDCSVPFRSVITNCQDYNEFKSRLDNVENFYLYTRKQNELKPEDAVKFILEKSSDAHAIGFQTNINKTILKACYATYSNKFTSLVNTNIDTILSEMRAELKDVPKIDQWSPTFKQNKVPSILASLAAVWTILESKDVAGIGAKIKPHCVQILCILRLLAVDSNLEGVDNHLSQVLTGQGKSIILGLLSALLAVTGHFVDTVCYSKYLTTRDAQAFQKFFACLQEFGLLQRIKYSKIEDVANDLLSPIINGGTETLRSLVTKLILDEFPEYIAGTSRAVLYRILLIDEVDVFFCPAFYGNTLNACTTVEIAALLEIQPKIWDTVEEEIHDEEIVFELISEFIHGLIKDPKNEKFKAFYEKTGILFKRHLRDMIKVAIHVSKAKENDVWFIKDFKIDDGILKFKDSFGNYRSDLYSSYYNTFNYFRMKKKDFDHKNYQNFGFLVQSAGHVSYTRLLKEYSWILGVSGVLTTLSKSEIEAIKSYDINKMTVMPSFFGGSKIKFNTVLNFVIEKTEDSWLEKIYSKVSEIVEHNSRAVLVFFDTEAEIKLFVKRFRNKMNRFHILTGNEEPSTLDYYINEAGLADTVTLATRNMGRGVDFKSNDLGVEERGGLHVIQTCFSEDDKEEVQFRGRTARKDNDGSYELILCMKHLKDLGYDKTDEGNDVTSYKQLCAIRKTKSEKKGATINENIKKSEVKDNLTMKFMKSFYEFTPDRRNDYFSCYPFVPFEDMNN